MKLTNKSIRKVKNDIEHYSMFSYRYVNMWIENEIWKTGSEIVCNYIWSNIGENLK